MSKKIIVRATLAAVGVDAAQVRSALSALGHLEIESCDEIEYKSAAGLTDAVWVYVTPDVSEPYLRVSGAYEREGDELSDFQMQRLRSLGVCTKVYGLYPRSDRYGTPSFVNDDDQAALIAMEHLFPVADGGFEVEGTDSGDDSCEAFWLCIAMPAGGL